jgi:hypothetical protein
MKQWIVRMLRRVLRWLEPPLPDTNPMRQRARELVVQAEALPGEPSGEWKRRMVYSRLVKEFPDRPKREAGMAIELAVAGLSGE